MNGLGLGFPSGSFQRSFALEAASERISASERLQEQLAATSRPFGAPQDGVGGSFQNAISATSNTADPSSDTRRPGNANLGPAGNASARSENSAVAGSDPLSSNSADKTGGANELTPEEEQQVRDLAARDREVRAHEQAHARVGGAFASQPTYEFVTGPDGQQYAVAGEVQIDAAPIAGDPEGTIRKLDIVIRAALAPAEPSSQDLAVARQARADQAAARQELRAQRQADLENATDGVSATQEGEETAEPGQPATTIAEVATEDTDTQAFQEQIFNAIQTYNASQSNFANVLFGGNGGSFA